MSGGDGAHTSSGGASLTGELERGLGIGFLAPGPSACVLEPVMSWWSLTSCGFLPDHGPCKQVCSVIGDTAMCSCFPGYAIMADGVSCEGEYRGRPHSCANLSWPVVGTPELGRGGRGGGDVKLAAFLREQAWLL